MVPALNNIDHVHVYVKSWSEADVDFGVSGEEFLAWIAHHELIRARQE